MAAQLVLSNPPGSVLVSAAGLVTGYLYRTDTPFFLPSLTRPRRMWRPLKAYRIPLSLYHLLARIFSPMAGASQAPRRASRILPGQIRDVSAAEALEAGGIRGLLAARAGLATTTPTRRATVPAAVETNSGVEMPDSPTNNGGARAAVGEWVDEMTGRGAARAPTEQEITALSNMFPNLSRETIVRALQRRYVSLSRGFY